MDDPRYHRTGAPSTPSTLSSAGFAMRKSSVAIVCSILLGIFLVFVLLLLYVCKYVPNVRARIEAAAAVAAAARAAGGGLDEKLRSKLPVVSYQQLVSMKRGKENVECCAICLLDFDEEAKNNMNNPPKKKRKRNGNSDVNGSTSGSGYESIRLLPKCGHSFHSSCIDMWLYSHASCPVCRDCLAPV